IEHLNKKLREGVQVRVALDAIGSGFSSLGSFDEFKKLGGKVKVFHTLGPLSVARFHKRNHRRSIVIDGSTAYIGGIAIEDTWLGHAEDSDHWRDMMYRVHGSMANRLQGMFAELWSGMTG